MNIVVLGARGRVGRRVTAEALSRGHRVTGVVRRPEHLEDLPQPVLGRVADVGGPAPVASVSAGADVVINATRPIPGHPAETVSTTRAIIQGVRRAGAQLVVAGGAAILRVPDSDRLLIDDPRYLPAELRPIGEASQLQYEVLEAEATGGWRYVCPPANLHPGVRTGQYRLGESTLLTDDEGESAISMEDLAVALLDTAEGRLPESHLASRVITVAAAPGL